MKRAFTITELVVTAAIIAVMASIGIGVYNQMIRGQNKKQAIEYLYLIASGEKAYYADNFGYAGCNNASSIRTSLGADVSGAAYSFSVAVSATGNGFTATATGNGNTITLDQNGNFTGN